jgi:NTE family protein
LPPPASPTFALALGAGGARGLAHIVALEAFDELGVRPAAIAGSSIGALVRAAYAAGMDAKAVRAVALGALRDRAALTGALLAARVRRSAGARPRGNPFMIDGERLLEWLWPAAAPDASTACGSRCGSSRPTTTRGPRRSSMRVRCCWRSPAPSPSPAPVKPVRTQGRLLVDGGAVNPLPFDLLTGRAQVLVAVDVTGVRSRKPSRPPGGFDAMFGTLQIMQAAIVAAKLKSGRPDIVVRPEVSQYRVLDFLKARAILAAAEPVKDELKREIERLVERR